jgi:hypothetical protein
MRVWIAVSSFTLIACGGSDGNVAAIDASGKQENSTSYPDVLETIEHASVDGGGPIDSSADGGACVASYPPADGGCNSLTNTAPPVNVISVPSAMPQAVGGSVVDGTYWKTASVVYTGSGGASGPTGKTEQTVLVLACGRFDLVTRIVTVDGPNDFFYSGEFTTAGAMCTFQPTCSRSHTDRKPPLDKFELGAFDASTSTITFYSTNPADASAVTYTRQ